MSFVPREYQGWADEALWQGVHTQPDRNPLIILPTGTGKSLCIAMFMYRMMAHYPHLRMMMCTHVKELIEGNYKTLKKLWPMAPAGVYSSGLGRKDVYAQLTFAGIQSVAKKAGRFGRIDFLLIDEAHLVGDSDSANYVKFIKALKERNPNLIVIGLTATAYRMGMGNLIDGDLFDYVAFDGSDGEAFIWFIENGYLIRPVAKDPGFMLDDSSISISGGEFSTSEASAALQDQNILERAVDMTIATAKADGRKCWLTFCQSIDDANLVADMFRYKGHAVEAVHSQREDRDEILQALREGKLDGVTNRDILTTGFDHPGIDLITMLRLTRSPGLWVQMLGRGTRPLWAPGSYYGSSLSGHNGGPPLDDHLLFDLETLEGRLASIRASGKTTCKVLDFVGNTMRLGPINYPRVPKRRGPGGGGDAPVRTCPICASQNHTSVMECPDCGYKFPPPERLQSDASTNEIVSSKVLDLMNMPPPEPRKEEVFGVNRMMCSLNKGKNGKLDTMRVDYYCGLSRYSRWVCFEHPENTFPRREAEKWWKMHGGEEFGGAPIFVADAVAFADKLKKPKFIKVHTNTRYPDILAYDHVGTRFELHPDLGGPPLQEPDPDPLERKDEDYQPISQYIGSGYYEDDIPF